MKKYLLTLLLFSGCLQSFQDNQLKPQNATHFSGAVEGVVKNISFTESYAGAGTQYAREFRYSNSVIITFENGDVYRFFVTEPHVYFGTIGKKMRYGHHNDQLIRIDTLK